MGPEDVIPNLPLVVLLKEFSKDTQLSKDVKEGTLVRPRANTKITGYGSKITSFYSCESHIYKSPLYLLGYIQGTKDDSGEKVVLAGYTDGDEIHEVEVDRDLVCEYKQEGLVT